ncbi:MAG TPA: adenosylcobinamide amidohydrolase [Candidatus Lustribacter sp.]|nr:adenosylcobinamide amidohydrolase [Candidatus Lustribacter sp.]
MTDPVHDVELGPAGPAVEPGPVVLGTRAESGTPWPVLSWSPPQQWRAIASTVVGGGIGPLAWWVNAMVAKDYHRSDPDAHVHEIAAALGLPVDRPGVGMLTAADVRAATTARDGGVAVCATVGLGWPVWAAAQEDTIAREHDVREPPPPGTINILVTVPVPLSGAALVNAVATATEAKTQALLETGFQASGTSSDAICIACPVPDPARTLELYGGPRSLWGARVARAVHAAVCSGARAWPPALGIPGQ